MRRFKPLILALLPVVVACAGPDFMPNYFPSPEARDATSAAPQIAAHEEITCTLQFTATLCVAISGEHLKAGRVAPGRDPICYDLPPIPLDIAGPIIHLYGDRFPSIVIEGHGLPLPITIDGRGDTTGEDNLGTGTINQRGEITIDDFDIYITAQESVGAIADFQLTTGAGPVLDDLPQLTGLPLGDGHALRLVGGTRLGPLFPSADEFLLGAELTASLEGTVEPTLAECGEGAGQPSQFEIRKLIIDSKGVEVPVPIPNGTQLEISTGTFIARNTADIGPRFESTGKFEIRNLTSSGIRVSVPPVLGVFTLESPMSLNYRIPADGRMILRIIFRPLHNLIDEPGIIAETLTLADDTFSIRATALASQGRAAVDLLTRDGVVVRRQIDSLDVGEILAPAAPQRAYFMCTVQLCAGSPLPRDCTLCTDATGATCQLLAINDDGDPIDEVDARCAPRWPQTHAANVIHFGSMVSQVAPVTRIIGIRNIGTAPLTIRHIGLTEAAESVSTHQFLFRPWAIFVADDTTNLAQHLAQTSATEGERALPFPITLPPYELPLSSRQAYLVLGYAPNDLRGSDGRLAGVGTIVTDEATLHIDGDGIDATVHLRGTTSIKDIPDIQLFVKTQVGLKERGEGATFAFRDITAATTEKSVPLFMRLTDSATRAVRITGLRITGPDAGHFALLDSREEIEAKPDGMRCTNPIFGPDGGIIDVQTELTPVSLAPSGYDLLPGSSTLETMPFFGCVNFHRTVTSPSKQRQFHATLIVATQQLGPDKRPARNPDGTVQRAEFRIPLTAVIDPIKGRMVFRMTQTLSGMLNQQFPTVASAPSMDELEILIAQGDARMEDRFLYLGAFELDPFDEMTIRNEAGQILSTPDDGITAVFRKIETRPLPQTQDDPLLYDYVNLAFDATAREGARGQFFDYPNVPEGLRTSGLKIFTGTLSYPGPIAPFEERPPQPSACEVVDPCSVEGQHKFGNGPTQPGKRGVCAYFYASGGAFNSPSFHTADEVAGGTRDDLCSTEGEPMDLNDMVGQYSLDGHLIFDVGLRFWGPTYFHNPNGPLGPFPPLDELWHFSLTSHVLTPPLSPDAPNLIPDPRLNLAKQEFKVNLNDPTLEVPQICPNNSANITLRGETYSSWQFLAPYLSKDDEGLIPAGCPEANNTFTGGSAFLHGRPIDHETGVVSVVGISKFSSRDTLSFVFKDVVIFVVMNGWICDPLGDEAALEGARCYDLQLNERDRTSQISIVGGQP